MASKLQLQRRIKTAQNISKTTKAMQMIAASKLKKAQDAALSSRHYVEKLMEVTGRVTTGVEKAMLPVYMKPGKQNGKTLYVVITPDKGLCGGLVANIARELLHTANSQDVFLVIGKKGESPVARITKNIVAAFPFGTTHPTYDAVYAITKIIDEQFITGKVDKVVIVSSHFVNMFTQKPKPTALLPITAFAGDEQGKKKEEKFHFQLF